MRLVHRITLSRPWFTIENLWKGKPVGLGHHADGYCHVLRNRPVIRAWWRR